MTSGAVVGLYGPPGSGKTAIASLLCSTAWMTSEQTTQQAEASLRWARNVPLDGSIEIVEVSSPRQVQAALAELGTAGVVVADSITRVGNLHQQAAALAALEDWARAEPARAVIAILQVNAKGEPAGLTENEHLTTAIVRVSVDDAGQRRLGAVKNREGPLGACYFSLGPTGVGRPTWRYSYSVEGSAGGYRLQPYPTPKARYAGLLQDYFAKRGRLTGGLASAGFVAHGYEKNRLEPGDVNERRAFAEAHGLRWLDHVPETPMES